MTTGTVVIPVSASEDRPTLVSFKSLVKETSLSTRRCAEVEYYAEAVAHSQFLALPRHLAKPFTPPLAPPREGEGILSELQTPNATKCHPRACPKDQIIGWLRRLRRNGS